MPAHHLRPTSLNGQFPDARWRASFRRRLRLWFEKHARDLPWRRSRDPYAVWISEIMLQQTQVETVKPYFQRFLQNLPDVYALAATDEQVVLRLWEGLGYYRRARQLHRAAQIVVSDHAGEFPHNVETLQTLPGIGRYTAGAIASIAFDHPAPIVEANTLRLFSRLLGYRKDPRASAGQRLLWKFAEQILPRKNTGKFNQALMELGSLVCMPTNPTCQLCPVMSLCPTFTNDWQDAIPLAKQKTAFKDIQEAAVIFRRRGHVLLRLCGEGERWAGLWDFPRVALKHTKEETRLSELSRKIQQQIGVPVAIGQQLTTIKHGVTRFRITLTCYEGKLDDSGSNKIKLNNSGKISNSSGGKINGNNTRPTIQLRWVEPAELESIPLSTTGRKLAALT